MLSEGGVQRITIWGLVNWLPAHTTCLKIYGLFFAPAGEKWAQKMCQPRSSSWQLSRTDGKVQLKRKESYFPSDLTTHQTTETTWWLAGCPSSSSYAGITLRTAPSALSYTAPGRFLNLAIAHVLGRKGVFSFKEEKVTVSGYGAWNWLATQFHRRPVMLRVKREEEEANAGLFPPC